MKTETAIEHFQTQKRLASAAQVSEAAVSRWKKTGRIPAKRAMALEKLTRRVIRVDYSIYVD